VKKPLNKDAPIPAALKGNVEENDKRDVEIEASASDPVDKNTETEKVKDDES